MLQQRRSSGTILVILALAAAGCEKPRVEVSHDQFQQVKWIAGTWRGSGGNYASFFEEYRVIDDSTIGMRSFTDSTLAVVSDSSRIELRGGLVQSRSADGSYYDVSEFTPTSIRFIRPGATSGGHTFSRVSDDEWTATLHGSQPPTVYTMRRLR